MKTRLLASCAAVAVLALSYATAPAQQPAPQQRPPAAGAADDATTPPGKTRRDGDAATSRQAPSKATEQPTSGRGAARDKDGNQPAQAQSPVQGDRSGSQGSGQPGRTTEKDAQPDKQEMRRNAREGDRDRSSRSRDRDETRRSAGERDRGGRDADSMRRGADTTTSDRDRSTTRSTARERQGERGSAPDQRASEGFSTRIDRENVRPLSRTNVTVTIGATVPRSVRMYDVPRDVVAIYPRYRGHKFVVVEDEIVVIEPRSRRIVATLPRAGGSRAAADPTTTMRSPASTTGARESRLRLSDSQRQVIRTTIMREPRCRLETRVDFVLFVPLPRTVEVCDFPAELVREVPAVERYRFVVRDDNIAIVDPDQYEVVEVIE